ncbi:MAG: hypothetical protein RLZZ127_2835 [Planctomycetota bacterium]
MDYDVVVIGSGPAGEGAAMQAAKASLSVCVVERYQEVGGGCTHWGTIPSKALRHAIFRLAEFKSHPLYSAFVDDRPLSFPDLLRSADSVIKRQVKMRHDFYERNRVRVLHGRARFTDPHALSVHQDDGADELVTGKHFVICTGSRPFRPQGIDFSHSRVLDSDTVLRLKDTPQSVTIYGAGVIGCEYASMFRNLGIKVNLVNTREKLLSYLDDEICDALSYHLRDQGVLIRHNEKLASVEPLADGVVLHLESGKKFKTDYFFHANGRSGNTDGLGLEAIGLPADSRGLVKVDGHYRTAVPHIYAAGDVIGPPSLASAAYDQGRFAAQHITTGHIEQGLSHLIPTGIYTSPEISSVGRTERELTEAKVPYEVGHSLFRSLARAQIVGQTVGMLKILFHRETREILGIHCFGYQASEIIHIGQTVMAMPAPHNRLDHFMSTTFNYPTMAEAYRVAALNGRNRLF